MVAQACETRYVWQRVRDVIIDPKLSVYVLLVFAEKRLFGRMSRRSSGVGVQTFKREAPGQKKNVYKCLKYTFQKEG